MRTRMSSAVELHGVAGCRVTPESTRRRPEASAGACVTVTGVGTADGSGTGFCPLPTTGTPSSGPIGARLRSSEARMRSTSMRPD